MDTVTQVLLGATIGAAAFQHRLGRAAIVIGGIGGLVPDLDLVSSLGGPWSSLVHHRGATHSLLFAPLMAWPFAWASHRVVSRRDGPGRGVPLTTHAHLWFWALFTHPLLDLFTTYGTQLLWPISNHRFSLDGVSIIDPVYSLPLAVALAFAWRAGATPTRTARWARGALAFTTACLLAGWGINTAIESKAPARWAEQDLVEVRAIPSFANLLYWRVIARDRDGAVHVDFYSLRAGWQGRDATMPRLDDPRVDAVRAREEGRILTWFSEGWIEWRWEEGAEGRVLWGEDQRYGAYTDPTLSMMAARVTFADDGQTVQSVEWVQDRRSSMDVGAELRAIWRGILGR